MDVLVRSMNGTVWREFRAEAVRRGVTAGALLTEIISEWLARQEG
jgi:hypothetical protein